MNCLIAAATALELKPFLTKLRKQEASHITINPDVLITGIGLTSTTYRLARQFMLKKPDLVIQAGVAGCFDNAISLGDVVFVKQDTIADQCVVERKNLKTLFKLKLVPASEPPYTKGWLVNPHTDLIKLAGLKAVRGISVNQITTDKKYIQFYKKEFNPVTESMEGAALHYVCLAENIPFLQLRSISNYIGERNKAKWNMKDAILNLNQALEKIVRGFAGC